MEDCVDQPDKLTRWPGCIGVGAAPRAALLVSALGRVGTASRHSNLPDWMTASMTEDWIDGRTEIRHPELLFTQGEIGKPDSYLRFLFIPGDR